MTAYRLSLKKVEKKVCNLLAYMEKKSYLCNAVEKQGCFQLSTAKRGGFLRVMKNLFDIISSVKGAKFASVVYCSDCNFPKKANLGNVTKVVSTTIQLNYDYESAVKARIAKQGGNPSAFKADKLPYGTWEIANKVFIHNGKRYLRYYGIKTKADTTYYVNGVLATASQVADIKAYLATKDTKSAKQSACGLDDHQVVVRALQFDNILSLSVDGETYTAPSKAVA